MSGTTRQGYAAGQLVTRRLDALGSLHSGFFGVSWWFVRVHLIAGGAWAMGAAHTMSYMFMIVSLVAEFKLDSTEIAFTMIGAAMLGAFVGSFVFGYLADTHGRKFSLLVAYTLTSAAGALCAASPSNVVLSLLRFVVGLGLGGLQPVICTLIMELSPSNIRGRALVYLDAFWPLGAILAMVLCRETDFGWRAIAGFSGAAFLYLPLIYFYVPESPKWLATSGDIEEAVRVLRTIEQASSVFHGEDADNGIKNLVQQYDGSGETAMSNVNKQMILQTHKPGFFELTTTRFRILMRFPYLSRTLMLWFVWAAMTLSNSAMCTYLDDNFLHEPLSDAELTLLTYNPYIGQFLGNLIAGALIDRLGRRYTIISCVLLSCAGSLLEVYVNHTMFWMVLSGFCRNFAFMAAWGTLFAYTPELYPTSVRVVGMSYAWGISRLGYFAGPYMAIWMTGDMKVSSAWLTWMLFVLMVLVALVILVFGFETAGRDTESRASAVSTDRETTGTTIAYQRHEDDDEEEDPPMLQKNQMHIVL